MKSWARTAVAMSLILAGCTTGSPSPTGGLPSPADESLAPSTAVTVAPPSSAAPVTIEYWHINTEAFGLPAIRDLIAAFQELHPNITVVERNQQGDYAGLAQNLQAAIAAKNPPAVAQIGHNFLSYVGDNFPHVAADDFLGADPDATSKYIPEILELGRYRGTLEGMPLSVSFPIMYVNDDLLQAAGIDPATSLATFEDVRRVAQEVTLKTGKFGLWIQPGGVWTLQALMESNGGRLIDESGRATFGSPPAVEATQFWGDLAQVDKVLPLLTNDEGRTSFSNGDIAIAIATSGYLRGIESTTNFAMHTAIHPTFGTKDRRLPSGGNSLWVFATDEQQKAAGWEWIKFLTSPDGQAAWVKGTGYAPVLKGLESDAQYLQGFYAQNPLTAPVLESTTYAVPWVNFPGERGPQVAKMLEDARDEVLTGRRDAESALLEAEGQANQLLGN